MWASARISKCQRLYCCAGIKCVAAVYNKVPFSCALPAKSKRAKLLPLSALLTFKKRGARVRSFLTHFLSPLVIERISKHWPPALSFSESAHKRHFKACTREHAFSLCNERDFQPKLNHLKVQFSMQCSQKLRRNLQSLFNRIFDYRFLSLKLRLFFTVKFNFLKVPDIWKKAILLLRE